MNVFPGWQGRFHNIVVWGWLVKGERVVIKIEAGSEGMVSLLSLEPGDWYSLSWLWCGDTFLGVEDGLRSSLPISSGSHLTLLGPLPFSKGSACPKAGILWAEQQECCKQRAGRGCAGRVGSRELTTNNPQQKRTLLI
jgi:hypothetical protein